MLGLYVHVPFCKRKCYYCDFYSIAGKTELIKPYVSAVLDEAQLYTGIAVNSLYLGGGTPSLLGADNITALMTGLREIFDLSGLTEATIEVNPDTASPRLFEAVVKCGINRVSIGVQSFSNNELSLSGRIHDAHQAAAALKTANEAGITNISADIIIGLPGQGWVTLQETIDRLLENEITHISTYCLSMEEGTSFAVKPPDNLLGDSEQAELYEASCSYLKRSGYVHYEISNFCRPDIQCQHNLNYWRGGEYIGLGPAAASHMGGCRFKNAEDLEKYLKNPQGMRIEAEVLELGAKLGEEAMLRLRLLEEGLNLREIEGRFSGYAGELAQKLEVLASNKYLIKRDSCYYIPPSRVLTSNSILVEVLS